jgi:hypothetical protein
MRLLWNSFALTIAGALQFSLLNAAGPRLLSPEPNAIDQPTEVTIVWEAGTPTNKIQNGGFEQLFTAWTSQFPWRVSTSTNAAEGVRIAEIRPEESTRIAGEAFIIQQVVLPAQGAAAKLSWLDSTTGSGSPGPHFKVQVSALFGTPAVVYEAPVGQNTDLVWEFHEVDLTSYLGRTITVSFLLSNLSREMCSVRLDNIWLLVTPSRVSYEVYLGRQPNLGVADLIATTTDTSWSLTGLEAGSTNYWKIAQISDGHRESSPVNRFVVASTDLVPPSLALAAFANSGEMRFPTQAGVRYQVEETSELQAPWQSFNTEILGDGSEAVVPVTFDRAHQFFRVVVQP